jgi:Methylase involved in ubiquinone/menaquinone biosynthesis
MNVLDAYNDWSATYDADENATRDLDRIVLERVLGKLHFGSIIEAGCGTGKNTELLSRLGDNVVALDFSAGMLEQAKAKLGHLPRLAFAVADITQPWPCEDRSANLVTGNLVLEHVEDLSPVFAEAARVLVSGGTFFISELHPFRQYQGTVANYRRDARTIQVPAFVHHISDFLTCAQSCGFRLESFQEWWHEKDEGKPPRLASFLLRK